MTKIILDRGHGSIDSNGNYTTAPAKMYKHPNGEIAYEGLLNSQFTKCLGWMLEKEPDIKVTYTVHPDDPRDISLVQRVRVANKDPKALFISLHCNAGGGEGFEIFTSRGQTTSDILAENIFDNVQKLSNTLSDYQVPLKLRQDPTDGDKDKEADFYVLRKTKGTAVLLELGFFDNYKEFKRLEDSWYQYEVCNAIKKGILEFLSNRN